MANEPSNSGQPGPPAPAPSGPTNAKPIEHAKVPQVAPAAPPSPNSPPPPAPPQPPSTSWLLAKEMPYALTILLAALGWCVVHGVDAIENSPSIEYVKTVQARPDKAFNVIFRVNNISLNHLFRGVSFYIYAPDGTLSVPNLTAIPPAKEVERENPSPNLERDEKEQRGKVCRFYVAQLQPASSWEFKAVLSNTSKPNPVLLVDFSQFLGTKVPPESIRLIENGLETRLVKYKINILFFACVLWLVIVIAYLVYLYRIRKKLV